MLNELALTSSEPQEIADAICRFKERGRRSATICAQTDTATIEILIGEFARHNLPIPRIAGPSDITGLVEHCDGIFFAVGDHVNLSSSLAHLADARNIFVWAPKTRHYFKSRPVFVQSIPKSGTHLVFECLRAFGYVEPPSLDLPDFVAPIENGV